jgi:hypothetical protein
MAEEVKQIHGKLQEFRLTGLGEYPNKKGGYLGCDHPAAGVA